MSSKMLVANWKMNGSLASCLSYFEVLEACLLSEESPSPITTNLAKNVIFCPPFPYLLPLQGRLIEHGFTLGAQDCSAHEKGAYTGDIGVPMLKDVGVSHVLIGHSERRQYAQETSPQCREKIQQAHQAGLTAIYCLGETKEDRENGLLETVLTHQLEEGLSEASTAQNTLIAYEPVWAIGTGLTPSLEDIQETHALITHLLSKNDNRATMKVLYGGSVKASNAKDILALPEVDGGLIGGASLDPLSMGELIKISASLS